MGYIMLYIYTIMNIHNIHITITYYYSVYIYYNITLHA